MYLFHNVEYILLSSPLFKFNDYKKKQERNILITNCKVYNCKDTSTFQLIQPLKEKQMLTKLGHLLLVELEQNLSSTSPKSTTTGMFYLI